MPYCALCDKKSPCPHWPSEEETLKHEPRPHDDGLDEAIDNAIRGKLTGEAIETGVKLASIPGTLVVNGTEYPAPETVVLNGYIYRRDDSSSVL